MTDTGDVWYVSYGSNLSPRRFITYLTGGAIPLSGHAERGSADPAPPRDVSPVTLPHVMYFGRSGGARWGGGGVAFIDPQRDERDEAFGLAYRIKLDQYLDVLCQENGWSGRPDAGLALPSVREGTRTLVPDGEPHGWYRTVVGLEPIDGVPAVTFTHPDVELATEPASPRYIRVVADGLASQHGLTTARIAEYLGTRPGIGWTPDAVRRLLE